MSSSLYHLKMTKKTLESWIFLKAFEKIDIETINNGLMNGSLAVMAKPIQAVWRLSCQITKLK